MARPITLSNGEMHVGISVHSQVHDFFYPYVGLENHSAGPELQHRIGIWVDGEVAWMDDDSAWSHTYDYPAPVQIGHSVARSDRLGILVEFDDFVDSELTALMRNIHVVNLREESRDIRLFMHQAFVIGDSRSNTDTAQYLPDSHAIVHYRGRRTFVISGETDSKPFDQYTIGLFGIEGHEGSWRDADDGELAMNNVEAGRVDSVLRFKLQIEAHGSARVHYSVSAGRTLRKALEVHRQITDDGLAVRQHRTEAWWHAWMQPATQIAAKLPKDHQDSFLKSVMAIKSHIDARGAVIASTDSTLLNYSRDDYAYCWPRDAAYALWPLIRMGYRDEPQRFFEFCQRVLHPSGYLMHKYRADGTLGSSWHPYAHGDMVAPPIQEDETAMIVIIFAEFYAKQPSSSLLEEFYRSLIVPMAEFLATYIDETTGLPKPSYDLWEQKFLTTTYTTATVYSGLLAAAEVATAASDDAMAVRWRAAADDIQAAAHKHLFNKARQAFYKGILVNKDHTEIDEVIDSSSTFGAFSYGLSRPGSEEMDAAFASTMQALRTNSSAPGVARYEDDDYRRSHPSVKGNWWIITTLWSVQYYLATGDAAKAANILDWVRSHAMTTGMLPEQIDPLTNEIVSPASLTWSQAEYVSTLLDTLGEAKK